MSKGLIIRPERPEEAGKISDLVRRAYADIAYSDHREHLMVERLRMGDGYVPDLSLTAEADAEAVGHIMLTKALIRNEDTATPALALAPLSVIPEFQGRGIGRALVEEAHRAAVRLGFGSIVLVGLPAYYPRFGYEPLKRYPITLPFAAPDKNCMILPLRDGALAGIYGRVTYAAGWLDH